MKKMMWISVVLMAAVLMFLHLAWESVQTSEAPTFNGGGSSMEEAMKNMK